VAEALVARAREGDEHAWADLVDRYLGMVYAVCRAYRLDGEDAAAVNQVVWLRLAEHLDRIRSPDAVGGWIAATARSECVRVLRGSGRVVPAGGDVPTVVDHVDEVAVRDVASRTGDAGEVTGIDAGLLVYERDRELLGAFAQLGSRCQLVLRLHMADPPPTDDEVAAALDVLVDTVGPSRDRCLARLRRLLV
jgi:RNA polymerase sigma factor (sigma-70 family)